MIIGIIGSRSRSTQADRFKIQDELLKIYVKGDVICSGGCSKGGDKFAEELSEQFCIPLLVFPADWHGNNPKSTSPNSWAPWAGFDRNTDIAKWSNLLIACVSADRSGGTEDTIKKFKKFHPDSLVVLV